MAQGSKIASIQQLAEVAIFQGLSLADLGELQPHGLIYDYAANEIVMMEGDRLLPRLYGLVQGALRLTRVGTSGKETILRVLLPGENFAAPALVGDGLAPATVTAMTDSQVLTIEREALFQQIRNQPEIAFRILEVYNQRLQQMHQTIHDLISERAIVRLARLLQQSLLSEQRLKGELPSLTFRLSHHHIARSIGITYEESVRLLRQMQEVVAYRRGGVITVLDRDALNAIAEGQWH
ncbi:Crp/Fnr family transcriptional regulator [Alkalinema sp. FACHB-956]|uniref:Crp/Fnr family transcriptional regulator n=1 Tax=Alkalinema sp. FACHB-956 TaxID=2692768 RepID=UPI001689415F|nr:Crp/Fnr family transcriptional regulator [Alkalinema sp. FACHB-956]MBD2328462.1 Crp/Fnr family transcriptional regulator [Alkalinema sp. FACHB-956]